MPSVCSRTYLPRLSSIPRAWCVKGYDGLELLLTVWAEPVPGPEVVEVDVVEVTTVVAGAEGLVPPVLTPAAVNHAEARPAGNGSRRATAAGRSVKVAAQPRKTAPKATEPRKGRDLDRPRGNGQRAVATAAAPAARKSSAGTVSGGADQRTPIVRPG